MPAQRPNASRPSGMPYSGSSPARPRSETLQCPSAPYRCPRYAFAACWRSLIASAVPEHERTALDQAVVRHQPAVRLRLPTRRECSGRLGTRTSSAGHPGVSGALSRGLPGESGVANRPNPSDRRGTARLRSVSPPFGEATECLAALWRGCDWKESCVVGRAQRLAPVRRCCDWKESCAVGGA